MMISPNTRPTLFSATGPFGGLRTDLQSRTGALQAEQVAGQRQRSLTLFGDDAAGRDLARATLGAAKPAGTTLDRLGTTFGAFSRFLGRVGEVVPPADTVAATYGRASGSETMSGTQAPARSTSSAATDPGDDAPEPEVSSAPASSVLVEDEPQEPPMTDDDGATATPDSGAAEEPAPAETPEDDAPSNAGGNGNGNGNGKKLGAKTLDNAVNLLI